MLLMVPPETIRDVCGAFFYFTLVRLVCMLFLCVCVCLFLLEQVPMIAKYFDNLVETNSGFLKTFKCWGSNVGVDIVFGGILAFLSS